MTLTRKAALVVLGATVWLLWPSQAFATTWTAGACDNATIQALHDNPSVLDGDTINVPAGASCTFSNHVVVTKCIAIHGAGNGVGGTHLIWSGSSVHYFFLTYPGAKTCRFDVGQFWFTKTGGPQTQGYVRAEGGPWPGNIRVHDNRFENPHKVDSSDYAMHVLSTTAIFDNNIVTGEMFGFMSHGRGDTDWAITPTFGGPAMNFIEHNTFDWGTTACYSGTGWAIFDSYDGGFAVIRYNTVTNGFMESHDDARNGLSHPSGFYHEVYQNTFATGGGCTVYKAIDMSGGTGVIWNNTMSGDFNWSVSLIDYRTINLVYFDSVICDGNQSIDQNTLPKATYTGWRCRYQIGTRGYSAGTIAAEPMYLWGNTAAPYNYGVDDGHVQPGGQPSTVHIVLNRDYFLSAKPGYTPYPYPHPNTLSHGGGGGDITAPSLSFTAPQSNYTTTDVSVPIAGTCTDDVGCGASVSWVNALTSGAGTASGINPWSATVALNAGINAITVSNTDAAKNTGTSTLNVLRESCGSSLPYTTAFALGSTGTDWPSIPCFSHYGSGARYSIASNQGKIGAASFDAEAYTGLTVLADQYIQATIGTVAPLESQLRLCVRTTGTAGNNADLDAIFLQFDGANSGTNLLSRYDNGALIEVLQFFPGVTPFTANVSTLRLEVQGMVVRAYYDADGPGAGARVQLGADQPISGGSIPAGTYTNGLPAICGTGINTTFDNVEIGNLTPPADTTPPVLSITAPATSPVFVSSLAIGAFAGTATDNLGTVSSCSATNSLGGAIPLTFSAPTWSNTAVITMAQGDNALTVTCLDPSKNAGVAVQHVILQNPVQPPSYSLRGILR